MIPALLERKPRGSFLISTVRLRLQQNDVIYPILDLRGLLYIVLQLKEA